jgi:hypothetical protein
MAQYAIYRTGLRSGYLRWKTPAGKKKSPHDLIPSSVFKIEKILALPTSADYELVLAEEAPRLLQEADEIVAGQVRLFGGEPRSLQLTPSEPISHWTHYALAEVFQRGQDIKFVWEPGRFGWACTLARAYFLQGDERYAEVFWSLTERFLEGNPANLGPHWASAQEVALRIIALVFAFHVFSSSSQTTPERVNRLGCALAEHAARIPPTLIYARAQNNNHLLTEAAGLYTAGLVLPHNPEAHRWRILGWQWLNWAWSAQIAPDGTYIQQSCNYHRLMLQGALWVAAVAKYQKQKFPEKVVERLGAATWWAQAMLDPETGRAPNLGPNDGAYILPLTSSPFSDFRPVVRAAAAAFLGRRIPLRGPVDELAFWLGLDLQGSTPQEIPARSRAKYPIIRHSPSNSWAYLRVADFVGRPGHADQLHLDLWWRGINISPDPGTYLYNAPAPWDNSLARSAVHNTITIDGLDQMRRAGRFLWLNWAKAEVTHLESAPGGEVTHLIARHNGYRRLGLTHQREVSVNEAGVWKIKDQILPSSMTNRWKDRRTFTARLHWLLPDWEWELGGEMPDWHLRLKSIYGWVNLRVGVEGVQESSQPAEIQLVRAGELLRGTGDVAPSWGWYSPTYGRKEPALSFSVTVKSGLPIGFVTDWVLPQKSS